MTVQIGRCTRSLPTLREHVVSGAPAFRRHIDGYPIRIDITHVSVTVCATGITGVRIYGHEVAKDGRYTGRHRAYTWNRYGGSWLDGRPPRWVVDVAERIAFTVDVTLTREQLDTLVNILRGLEGYDDFIHGLPTVLHPNAVVVGSD